MLRGDTMTPDAYWQSTADGKRDTACVVCSALSLMACVCVLRLIHRNQAYYVHAINHCIIATFVFGLGSSVNQLIAGCIRLSDPSAMRYYCDISGVVEQLTVVPAIICEGGFFAAALRELSNRARRDDRSYSLRMIGATVVFGIVSAGISFALLPLDPLWGTRYSGSGSSWCWLPPTDNGNHNSPIYSALQVIFGYLYFAVVGCIGVYCYAHLIRLFFVTHRLRALFAATGQDKVVIVVPRSVRLRIVYFAIFVLTWTVGATHRYANLDAGSLASNVLSTMQAILQPINPLINVVVFLLCEGILIPQRVQDVSEDSRDADPTPPLLLHQDEAVQDDANENLENASSGITTVRDAIAALHAEYIRHQHRNHIDENREPTTANVLIISSQGKNEDKDNHQEHLQRMIHTTLDVSIPQVGKPSLSAMLSLLAGYCDTSGFLTMELFTAHITGNFATLGMSLVQRTDDIVVKLGGLVVFIIVLFLALAYKKWRQSSSAPSSSMFNVPQTLLLCQMSLLLAACIANSTVGPVTAASTRTSVATCLTGWLVVAGMSLQNLFQRFWLVGMPMTTLMTGNTVGAVVDAYQLRGDPAARSRVKRSAVSILFFTSGCAWATIMTFYLPELLFVIPPLLSLVTLATGWEELDA